MVDIRKLKNIVRCATDWQSVLEPLNSRILGVRIHLKADRLSGVNSHACRMLCDDWCIDDLQVNDATCQVTGNIFYYYPVSTLILIGDIFQ